MPSYLYTFSIGPKRKFGKERKNRLRSNNINLAIILLDFLKYVLKIQTSTNVTSNRHAVDSLNIPRDSADAIFDSRSMILCYFKLSIM